MRLFCHAELMKSPVLAKVKDCSKVSCGIDFTIWLCKGQLYSAGNPQHGQLGHGTDHEYNAKECMPQHAPELAQQTKHIHTWLARPSSEKFS